MLLLTKESFWLRIVADWCKKFRKRFTSRWRISLTISNFVEVTSRSYWRSSAWFYQYSSCPQTWARSFVKGITNSECRNVFQSTMYQFRNVFQSTMYQLQNVFQSTICGTWLTEKRSGTRNSESWFLSQNAFKILGSFLQYSFRLKFRNDLILRKDWQNPIFRRQSDCFARNEKEKFN